MKAETKQKKDSMRQVRIEKITLNIGTGGKSQDILEKSMKLIKELTGIMPVKTITTKRIPAWGLRPGLPIGCKLTLRGETAEKLFKRLVEAKDSKLKDSYVDQNGNVSFGIHEYIDIPEAKYLPDVGVIGLQVCATLERPGYRIKKRRLHARSIPHKHRITKQEAMQFMQEKFHVSFKEEEA